jgi:hypothetical protein
MDNSYEYALEEILMLKAAIGQAKDVIRLQQRHIKKLQEENQRARNVHKQVTSTDEDGTKYHYCDACAWSYPCPTIKALDNPVIYTKPCKCGKAGVDWVCPECDSE